MNRAMNRANPRAVTDKWTAAEIPDQSGRWAVVTGADSGLGLVTARELARAGAGVVLASRNPAKAQQAVSQIRAAAPSADLEVVELDLGDLAVVRAFADRVQSEHDRVDLLVNNAGVMAPPRRLTSDGFESQLGINHLGHFALTGMLLERLLAAPEPRVVTVTSEAMRIGTIKFDDLQGEHRYNSWLAYGQSKLANMMFSLELQRRASDAGTPLRSLAAHPGWSATNLQSAGPSKRYERAVAAFGNKLIAQSADMGALPTLFAATVADIPGGRLVGPDGLMQIRGHPRVVWAPDKAVDRDARRRLWEASEELTGIGYEFAVTAQAS
jgi:NAD(P)-dependent dehydrogenase (short-subunit alcohol dehydrogenase family)